MDGMPESIARLYRELDEARERRRVAEEAMRNTVDPIVAGYEANARARAIREIRDIEEALEAREA